MAVMEVIELGISGSVSAVSCPFILYPYVLLHSCIYVLPFAGLHVGLPEQAIGLFSPYV